MNKQWKKAILVLAVAICMVAGTVLSVSAATTTDKNAGAIKELSSGVVSQAYSEISSYRAEGKYTAPGTPSGYSDYVFAGWFTNEACTTEATATSGSAYAKFVVKDVLGVKAQFLAGTSYDDKTSSMRFVTTVDSLDYNEVGFKCVLNGVTKTAKSDTVYKKLFAAFSKEDGSTAVSTLLPTSFSETTSQYFMACILKDIPNADFGDAIQITPYWETLDGTTVYGDTVVKTVNNGYMEIATGVTVEDTAAYDYSSTYKTWITDTSYTYVVQGGCIGVDNGKTYYYQAMVASDNTLSYILKIDMESGDIVACSGALSLGHTNDITYNKDLNVLVVCQNAPNNQRISFVNPSTLEPVNPSSTGATFGDGVTVSDTYITTSHEETTKFLWWTQTTDVENNLFSIEYNSYQQKYVVGISGGQTFRILDKDFSDPNASGDAFDPTANTSGFTTQGVVADDSYIYFVLYHDGEVDNASYEGHVIAVYDWNGNYVTVLEIPTTSIPTSVEPENIAIYDNVMYISCQNKKIYKVAEFEIATSIDEAKIGDYYYDTLEDAVEAVQDGETITILSEKVSVSENLNIDNKNVTITNEPGVNVVVKKGADFSGILISNKASGVKIQSAETGSLTFTGNGYSGSSLVYNYADATLDLDGVTFKDILSNGSGSAVHVNAGTVTINDCDFENNTASNQGGALWVASDTVVTVTASEFTGNSTVNQTGGAVYTTSQNMTITGTDFIRNESATTAGAINNGGVMTITDCDFAENKANSGNGGAVQVADGGQATINGTGTFEGNSATGAGGALRMNNAKVTVEGQTFDSNTSGTTGGAVDIQNGTFDGAYENDAYVFTNNTFVSNEAGSTGGAINNAARELQITDCTFGSTEEVNGTDAEGNPTTETVKLGNTATTYGGALYLNSSKVSISGSEFNVNKAAGSNGGAIYFKGQLTLNSTDFTGNEAKGTGGAFHSEGGTTIADSCDFTSNKAGGNGGACRIVAGGSATFTGTGTFTGNETTGAVGGAIQVNSATLSVTGYTFDNNTSKTNGGAVYVQSNTTSASFTSSTFVNNSVTAGNGGAIYAEKDVTITDTSFGRVGEGNHATAGNGGAIYITNSKTVTLTKTDGKATPNFVDNEAKLGGAIYTNTGVVNVTNYNFVSNSATTYGGAVYLGEVIETQVKAEDGSTSTETTLETGTLNATNCIFEENTGTHGATLFAKCGAINVTSGTFNTNIATKQGGAIYLAANGTCKVEGSTYFNTNEAGDQGGAILVATGADGTIDGAQFTGNKANSASGGAIYKNGSLTIKNSDFTSNTAGSVAGAINNNGGDLTAENCDFIKNEAGTMGGALQTVGSGATISITVTDGQEHVFQGNTAQTGGGAIRANTATTTVTGYKFDGNTSETLGGAVYVLGGTFTLKESTFVSNTAVTDGGAIYTSKAITLEDNTYGAEGAGNSAVNGGAIYVVNGTVSESGSSFIGNTANDGGAVYVGGDDEAKYAGTFTATGCTFDANTATQRGGAIYLSEAVAGTSATINGNSVFTKNVATKSNGGAIYTISTKDTGLLIEDSTFGVAGDTEYAYANKATTSGTYGGAVYGASGSSTKVVDTNFYYNQAYNGGAIGTINASSMTIVREDATSAVFEGNYASNQGGAGRLFGCTTGTITGYTFKDNSAKNQGGALEIERGNLSSGEVAINNCKFDSNESTAADGGAIRVAGSGTVKLVGSTEEGNISLFTGNTAKTSGGALSTGGTGTYQISGYTFTGNTAEANGGAIYAQTTISIAGSTFGAESAVNSAVNGGAIYTTAKTTITDTNFASNTATENGGAIYATNAKAVTLTKTGETTPAITGNSAVLGGAIYTDTGTITATGYTFNDNEATSGGAIYVGEEIVTEGTNEEGTATTETTYESGVFNATTCVFNDNEAKSGGAVYVVAGQTSIEGSQFNTNTASDRAGAIYVDDNATVTKLADSTLANNSSSASGGAIFNTGTLNMSATTFSENHAGSVGGAINCETGVMTAEDCSFVSNTSVGNGGAVQVANASDATFTVSENGTGTFHGNIAGTWKEVTDEGTGEVSTEVDKVATGGAIRTNNSLLSVTGYTFDGNSATSTGGAVDIGNGAATSADGTSTEAEDEIIKFNNSTFINNTAESAGGAIQNGPTNASGRDMTITGCKFGESVETGNTAGDLGGAIYHRAKKLNISTTSFIGNKSASIAPPLEADLFPISALHHL